MKKLTLLCMSLIAALALCCMAGCADSDQTADVSGSDGASASDLVSGSELGGAVGDTVEAVGTIVGFADGHSVEIMVAGQPYVYQVYDEAIISTLQSYESQDGVAFTFAYTLLENGGAQITELK